MSLVEDAQCFRLLIARTSATAQARTTLSPVELRAAGRYVGERKVLNGGAVTLPSYRTFDLGAGTNLGRFQMDAALTNVFDELYYYTDNLFVYSISTEDRVLPGELRSLSLRARWRF